MADELGKQGYVTGEMWKNKSPSHLAVNMAGFSRLALPALHWTWSHEALRVWCNTCFVDPLRDGVHIRVVVARGNRGFG